MRTVANTADTGKTNQGTLNAGLTTPISANTSVYANARYQRLRSDITQNYNEAAIIVGLSHTFR